MYYILTYTHISYDNDNYDNENMAIVGHCKKWKDAKELANTAYKKYLDNRSLPFYEDGAEIEVNDEKKRYHAYMYDPDGIHWAVIFIVKYE